MTALLSLRGVRKAFGDHEVCRGIDLDIAKGEMVCLIGASGSGKSTLMRLMNLLEPVDDGQIFFDGRDIAGLARADGISKTAARSAFLLPAAQMNQPSGTR